MKTLKQTSQFKKDLKRIKNNPSKIRHLEDVLTLLVQDNPLPAIYRPHQLTGDYKGCMECHVESDSLLIWIDEREDVIKTRKVWLTLRTFQMRKTKGAFVANYARKHLFYI